MKDTEELASYCSKCDDFKDEWAEVMKDQGAALPLPMDNFFDKVWKRAVGRLSRNGTWLNVVNSTARDKFEQIGGSSPTMEKSSSRDLPTAIVSCRRGPHALDDVSQTGPSLVFSVPLPCGYNYRSAVAKETAG